MSDKKIKNKIDNLLDTGVEVSKQSLLKPVRKKKPLWPYFLVLLFIIFAGSGTFLLTGRYKEGLRQQELFLARESEKKAANQLKIKEAAEKAASERLTAEVEAAKREAVKGLKPRVETKTIVVYKDRVVAPGEEKKIVQEELISMAVTDAPGSNGNSRRNIEIIAPSLKKEEASKIEKISMPVVPDSGVLLTQEKREPEIKTIIKYIRVPFGSEMALTPMVYIPAGTAHIGAVESDDSALGNEKPSVKIYMQAFYMEKHEVSNKQYKVFLDKTDHRVPFSDDFLASRYNWDEKTRTYPKGMAEYPVVNVSREDARAYASWAGRRLPSEAEWEYAARKSDFVSYYPWGNSHNDRIFANYDGKNLVPVMKYLPNITGVFDMAGNAFEWVEDNYLEDYHDYLQRNGQVDFVYAGFSDSGVLKGGAFYSTFKEVRVSYREYNDPEVRYYGYGFRCVADDLME